MKNKILLSLLVVSSSIFANNIVVTEYNNNQKTIIFKTELSKQQNKLVKFNTCEGMKTINKKDINQCGSVFKYDRLKDGSITVLLDYNKFLNYKDNLPVFSNQHIEQNFKKDKDIKILLTNNKSKLTVDSE